VAFEVRDAASEEAMIRSDFPEIAMTRQSDSRRASGFLNCGGPKVVGQTRSGRLHLRKGPPPLIKAFAKTEAGGLYLA
jgi:hypothetical protein